MQYKGYIGQVEFDADAGVLHGEVMGIRDVVTFQGQSVKAVEKAFHESVDDYLAFCQERGEDPDKPCSGKFVVRLDSILHRKLNMVAAIEGVSLNGWVAERLKEAVDQRIPASKTKRTAKVRKVTTKTSRTRAKTGSSR
ncbi:MAG TPA: toxin-antitoxin system HicB family antitoxin [Phycisphaerales bacterium]|nr:toxin-antitoxin system HicB family antitoxin [Phycisphaerales bacterium]HCD35036.1 toxin-antitoxin system HicB family antitoxin [Phycisphaerales bacterium]